MPDPATQSWQIRSPASDQEWADYYQLRWEILREPWQQPWGSERDEFDASAVHRCAVDENSQILAIGRLHFIDDMTGQIRYMAVTDSHQRCGLGTRILKSLEEAAHQQPCSTLQLNARENAVPFYEQNGYRIIKQSHLLYNRIQHYLMQKHLDTGNSSTTTRQYHG